MQGRLRKQCGVSFDDGRFRAAEWHAPRPLIHPRQANVVEIDNAGPARPQADLPMFVGRMMPLIFAGREKLSVIEERLQHRPRIESLSLCHWPLLASTNRSWS